jgi:hypothetical protein
MVPYSAVQAVVVEVVDFTSPTWNVGQNLSNNFIGSGITLSSSGGNLTFNSSDGAAGCGNTPNVGLGSTGLDCTGDGISIGNDEITEGGDQILTVTFNNLVNIHEIHFLDLFAPASEDPGEKAIIEWSGGGSYEAHAIDGPFNDGGYWEVTEGPSVYDSGLAMSAINSFTLTGFDDGFSDYALARIEYSVVPIPATFWMFGTALIGFVAFSRRTKV